MYNMKYPNQITIGGIDYKVLLVDEMITHPDYPGMVGQGICQFNDKQIKIYNNRGSPQVTEETFLHESLEAMNREFDMGLPHQTIKTLGVAMHQLLRTHGPMIFSDWSPDELKEC